MSACEGMDVEALARMLNGLRACDLRAILRNLLIVAGEFPQEYTARAVVHEIRTHHDYTEAENGK